MNVDMSTLQQAGLQGLVLIVLGCSADSSTQSLVPHFTLVCIIIVVIVPHSAAQYDAQFAAEALCASWL